MRAVFLSLLVAGVVACEISSVALTEPADLLIAEIYLELPEGAGPARAVAFLHRTLGTSATGAVDGARVTLTSGNQTVGLFESGTLEPCLQAVTLGQVTGTCFENATLPDGFVVPGGVVTASVEAGPLETLTGTTTVPGDFSLVVPAAGVGECLLEAGRLLELEWTTSAGAWAYMGETLIAGLPAILEERGIETGFDEDPLSLVGLSISSADTVMVFPSEFGLFDRFDLDQEVALLLQGGLPEGASADITIAAIDRNFVNWVRGGSFNPSGTVRVPSLRGAAGSGVLASYVTRTIAVSTLASGGRGPC